MDINSPLFQLYQTILRDRILTEHWTEEMEAPDEDMFHHENIEGVIPQGIHQEMEHGERPVQVT